MALRDVRRQQSRKCNHDTDSRNDVALFPSHALSPYGALSGIPFRVAPLYVRVLADCNPDRAPKFHKVSIGCEASFLPKGPALSRTPVLRLIAVFDEV